MRNKFIIIFGLKLEMEVKIEQSWKKALDKEFNEEYFEDLVKFVKQEYQESTVYPPAKFIFRAFEATPIDKVKVIILGQDPYHEINQANGLCFAVNEGVRHPPSLQNIYKEIKSDLGVGGNIHSWPGQGVLLLNSTLTVRANQAGSHQNKGWERFTDAAIKVLSEEKNNLVFILWGKYAQEKGVVIDEKKHMVLKSPHPSPFSAYHGFFGSKPFSSTNTYLMANDLKPIDW